MKMKLLVASATAALLICGAAQAATNLIVNGDFELGNVGFGSDYTLTTPTAEYPLGNGYPEGTYSVVTDPQLTHNLWASFTDHTSGAGKMMVVNGDVYDPENPVVTRIWYQNVAAISAGTHYKFTGYLKSTYNTAPGQVTFTSGGEVYGSQLNLGAIADGWQLFTADFTAATDGPVQIALWNQNGVAGGNDFAIDDLRLSAVPEPATWAMMLIGFAGMGSALRNRRRLAPAIAA